MLLVGFGKWGGPSIIVCVTTQPVAGAIHDRRGGERITDLLDPAAPRVGLSGVHDGKRFAELSGRSETFVSLMREFYK